MERRLLERNKVATTVYLSVPGGRFHRCRAKNLSAMGVFLEIKSLGLPAGTVVNLVFAVNLGDTIRLHRRKAVHQSLEAVPSERLGNIGFDLVFDPIAVAQRVQPLAGVAHQLATGIAGICDPFHDAFLLKPVQQLLHRLLGDAHTFDQRRLAAAGAR